MAGTYLRATTRPTLSDESYQWAADTPLDILGDAVAGTFPLRTVQIVRQPAFGTVTVVTSPAADAGNVLFEPPPDIPQEWETDFDVIVRDRGGLATAKRTITVGVTPVSPDPNYPNGYDRRIELWVNARPAPNATLTNFVALVEITLADLRTVANGGFVTDAAGDDIRPELPGGTALDFWIVDYNPTTGYLLAYVRLPSWDTASALNFYLYYGNAAQTTPEGNSNDALSGALMAWDARTGADLKGGIGALTMTSVGQGTLIGDAGDFDGATSVAKRLYADGGLNGLASLTAMTVQVIVKSDVTGGRRGIIMQGPPTATDETSSLFLAYVQAAWTGVTNGIQFQWRNAAGSNYVVSPSGRHTTNRQIIHATWVSGEAPKLYLDGVLQVAAASGYNAGAGVTPNGDLYLGVAPNVPVPGSTGWNGLIDEPRILPVALSAAHIAAEVANITSPSTFISIGTPQDPVDPDLPPIALNDTTACPHETSVLIDVLANDSDPAGLALSIDSVTTPSPSGTAVIEAGKIRYTPIADFSGPVTFSYTIENTAALQATANVTVTVAAAGSVSWAGPWSELPWYSGGYYRLAELDRLRLNPASGKKRRLDILTTFHRRGGWSVWGTPAATTWKQNPGLWYGWLLSDNTPAVNIAMQPFCSDPGLPGASDPNNTLATWPAKGSIPINAWIAPNRPVGYQQNGLTNAQKRERHMDVWQHMVDGHFDHIWEPKLIEFRNAIPILASKRIIWRPWWETNITGGAGVGGGLWGHTNSQRVSSPLGGMRTAADIALVKRAYAHFNDIIRSVFPNNSWFHWNPLRSTIAAATIWPAPEPSYGNTMDLIDPLQWDFIGPDFYDRDDIGGNTGPGLPGGGTYEDRWNQIAFAGTQAAPKGIVRWFEWLRNVARPINPNVRMGIGEWGVWRLATDHQGTAGDDDALYIARMYDLMAANSDIMGYDAYYNNRKSDGTEETMLTDGNPATFFPNSSAMYKTKWATLT